MHFRLPDEVMEILSCFEANGYEIYIVGGAVRDIQLGRPVDDWDYTTNATPEEILKLYPDGFYDNQYGTVGVPSPSKEYEPHEITTFRTESQYSDNRRPDSVSWGKSLKEDLQRRDFTINALAINKIKGTNDPTKYEVVDIFGGQDDLKKKLIRAVGDPNERFREDALRMMRAVRIAAEIGFNIEKDTHEAIHQNALLLERIARERIREEFLKILASPHPDSGVLTLKETGLLKYILPELEKAFGVEQKSPERHHIYDVGTHSVMALKHCKSTDPITRFAALIHDIGKPLTYKVTPEGVITFYNHEVVGANIAKRIAERLKLSNKEAQKLITLVRWHQFTVDERQTDSAIRRFIRHVGKEYLDDMLALRVGDRLGGGALETSWRLEAFKDRITEVQKQPFAVKDLKINGNDVMKELNIAPGRKVGEILKQLFDEVVEQKIPNEKEALMKRLGDI